MQVTRMNLRNRFAVLVMTSTLSSASTVMAQQQPQTTQPRQTGQVIQGNSANAMNGDQMLATVVTIGNQKEVATAKWAQEKADCDDVKEFASMLVKDHQAMLEKLKQYAPQASNDQYLHS